MELFAQAQTQVFARIRDRTTAANMANVLELSLTMPATSWGLTTKSGTYFYDGANFRWWLGAAASSDAVASTTVAPFTQSLGLAWDLTGSTWKRLPMIDPHAYNQAYTIGGIATASVMYADDGATLDPLKVGGSGELQITDVATRPGENVADNLREINKKNTQEVTPAYENTATIGTATVTIFASREVINDPNFCLWVKNTDGVDPIIDVDIEGSPDGTEWVDLGWAACDGLVAGSTCVYCVSGNAYRYIRGRGTAADANQASSRVWYTGNKN